MALELPGLTVLATNQRTAPPFAVLNHEKSSNRTANGGGSNKLFLKLTYMAGVPK